MYPEYTRVCKRCNKSYKTPAKHSKVCDNCNMQLKWRSIRKKNESNNK